MGRKNRTQKKPRFESILATTAESVTEISFTYDSQTGSVEFEQDVTHVRSELAYERALKAEKVTASFPVNTRSIPFVNQLPLQAYTWVIGVDTNTDKKSGTSVTGICVAAPVENTPFQFPFVIEFAPSAEEPERMGWEAALTVLSSKGWLRRPGRFLLVVDHGLSLLPGIQSRNIPLWRNYLPQEFDICYASADAADGPTGHVLKSADWVAGAVMKRLSEDKCALADMHSGAPLYRTILITKRTAPKK